jgi:tRNA modification GTPase
VFSTSDTIVAIATPPGRGALGVVRLSGSTAHEVARRLTGRVRPFEPRVATLTTIRQAPLPGSGCGVDQVVVTYFRAPASYTGDDVIEVSAHGSPVVLRAIVEAAVEQGARLAAPGEFTLRAYVNGRIDLTQAEAVADLIEAVTPLQARAAFDQLQGTLTRAIGKIDAVLFELVAGLEASIDFPEEGYHFLEPGSLAASLDALTARTSALLAGARRGRFVREGLQVAIVGAPNVGKSSLFNALVGTARAIVTDQPGTTRDLVSETVDFDGFRVTLVDTAGLRTAADAAEIEGVSRSRQAAQVADVTLHVLDRSRPLPDGAEAHEAIRLQLTVNKEIIVASKSDLPPVWTRDDAVAVSARTGAGLDLLRERILGRLGVASVDASTAGEEPLGGVGEPLDERPDLANVRHIGLVERAHEALLRARFAAGSGDAMPEEFVLADLQEARAALEEVTGRRTPEDVLTAIFSRFCVGK